MKKKRNRKLDLFSLALMAAVVFLGMSLLTCDLADRSGYQVGSGSSSLHNACGRLGSMVAYLLLKGLGFGAYYFVLSLGVTGALLLVRRGLDQPIVRTVGWCLSLFGLTTLVTLTCSKLSLASGFPPGGYLGTAGCSLMQIHLAMAGALILTFSLILAGLLLCTDYLLVEIGQVVFKASMCCVIYSGRLLFRVWAFRPMVVEKEESFREEDEQEEEAPAIRFRGKSLKEEPDCEEEEEEGHEEEEEEEELVAPQDLGPVGVKGRLASALRIKKPQTADREEVIAELEAASCSEQVADYELPSINLLLESDDLCLNAHEKEVRRKAKILERTFSNFGFKVKVVEIETGPVIAQYEVQLQAGLRLSKITGLSDDLAIALRVPSVRIVAPIPGKNTVGIEVPNENRQLVRMREVIEELGTRAKRLKIPVFLGKDVSGNPMAVDLTTLPHLLIAGRTGTGKSVCLNSIIVSMLMTRRPDEVRMLMIDPKMVELSPYKKLPHLMHPVVTDMRKAEAILGWAVDKMEERYGLLARAGVRHVSVYNQLGEDELKERLDPASEEEWQQFPKQLSFIVIVADEIADLMIMAGKDVEQHIIRLAQKSRAVGIHLILATQKPTVDVITGLIKSNLPARIAFQVASRTDSRVVLDEMGAEKLLGNGDLLFLFPGTSTLMRGQGTYLSDDEISNVLEAVATSEPQFVKELVQLKVKDEDGNSHGELKHRDDLYESAVDIVIRERRGSVSLLQRNLGIGYGRAARLIDYMAEDGIVGTYNGSQAREVLISLEEWENINGESRVSEPDRPKRSNKVLLTEAASEPEEPDGYEEDDGLEEGTVDDEEAEGLDEEDSWEDDQIEEEEVASGDVEEMTEDEDGWEGVEEEDALGDEGEEEVNGYEDVDDCKNDSCDARTA